jgi:hypothetical protein
MLLNNHVLIRLDKHFDKILDSKGNPFLHLVTHWESFMHVETSGTVIQTCKELTKNFLYGTTVEIKEGDRCIFHYLAILRDRDGTKIVHNKMIGEDYIIKYDDIFAVIRDGEVIPVNGFVILEGEPEEFKTNLIIPDYLKKKRSKVICTIKYLGTPVTYNFESGKHSIPHEPDSDDWHIDQKVIIPSWAAIPLMVSEHSILDTNKVYYRSQRRWMNDYNWVMDSIKQWQINNPIIEGNESDLNLQAYNNFIRQDAGEHGEHQNIIVHKQKTKYLRNTNRIFTS